MLNKLFKQLDGQYWLISGSLFYLGTAISSIFRSMMPGGLAPPTGFIDITYLIIDWLAACIIYFFIGGMIGVAIDYFVSIYKKRKYVAPLWFWLTLALWVITSVSVALLHNPDMSTALIIVFPLAFGLFFSGSAFALMFPKVIVQSYYGKLVFDFVFLGLFGSWIYAALKLNNKTIARILVSLIFAILFLGFVGCAINLA